MKWKWTLAIAFFLFLFQASAQFSSYERFADTVLAYSSQYTSTAWAASQIVGVPTVWPNCGDNSAAWASQTANGQREFLVAGFYNPQPARQVRIYQTIAAGGIDTVYLRNAATQQWNTIYTATALDINSGGCNNYQPLRERLVINLPATTPYNVDAVRIAINSPAVDYYQEIDAVSLFNSPSLPFLFEQYADSVITYSSSYGNNTGNNSYSPEKIKGQPTQYGCGDNGEAWCPATIDGGREFIEMFYRFAAAANGVKLYQNYTPGGVDTVYVRNASTGSWNIVYSYTATLQACNTSLSEIYFPTTAYPVDAVRLAINTAAVSGWQEIDAVGLLTDLSANAKITVKSGNWNDPTTWSGNAVPLPTDMVYIGAYHQVQVNANATCRKLQVLKGATIKTLSGNTLTILE